MSFSAPLSRFAIPADLFTVDLFDHDVVRAPDGAPAQIPARAAIPPVEFMRAKPGLHAAACEAAEAAGLPVPVVPPVALPPRPAGEPVSALCPVEMKMGPILALDLLYRRVVVLAAGGVYELEITDATQFFVGRSGEGRAKVEGFGGAELALLQLEADAARWDA